MSEKLLEQLRAYIEALCQELRKLLRSVERVEFYSEQINRIVRMAGVASDVSSGKLVDRMVLAEILEDLYHEIVQAGRAAVGAEKFSLVPQGKDKFVATIDEVSIELPKRLGQLVGIMAANDGPSHDGLIPYKAWNHVRMQMALVPGVPISDHCLVVQLARLRKLFQGKLHAAFIQADRTRGLRLAVRSQPPPGPALVESVGPTGPAPVDGVQPSIPVLAAFGLAGIARAAGRARR